MNILENRLEELSKNIKQEATKSDIPEVRNLIVKILKNYIGLLEEKAKYFISNNMPVMIAFKGEEYKEGKKQYIPEINLDEENDGLFYFTYEKKEEKKEDNFLKFRSRKIFKMNNPGNDYVEVNLKYIVDHTVGALLLINEQDQEVDVHNAQLEDMFYYFDHLKRAHKILDNHIEKNKKYLKELINSISKYS